MDTALVFLAVVTAFFIGLVMGVQGAASSTTSDCDEMGRFRYEGSVYECKRTKANSHAESA